MKTFSVTLAFCLSVFVGNAHAATTCGQIDACGVKAECPVPKLGSPCTLITSASVPAQTACKQKANICTQGTLSRMGNLFQCSTEFVRQPPVSSPAVAGRCSGGNYGGVAAKATTGAKSVGSATTKAPRR